MTDLASPPPLPDHRFGELRKGKHYAYARGLNIAPMHLPEALDAMEADGWTLMAVFGETTSDRVGFIFKRSGAAPAQPTSDSRPKETKGLIDFTLPKAAVAAIPEALIAAGVQTAPPPAPSEAVIALPAPSEAIIAALNYADSVICRHEQTHRGGNIWTICDECGEKWADDRGGFEQSEWPELFDAAMKVVVL